MRSRRSVSLPTRPKIGEGERERERSSMRSRSRFSRLSQRAQGQKLEKEREREREREYDDKGDHNHKVLSDRSVLECGEDGSVVDSDDPDDLRFEQLVGFRDRSVQIRVQHRVVSVLSVGRCADGERYEGQD